MGATTLTMIGWSEELSLSIMKSIISHLPIVECTKVKGTCKTWDKFTRISERKITCMMLFDNKYLLVGTDCDPAHDHDLQIWKVTVGSPMTFEKMNIEWQARFIANPKGANDFLIDPVYDMQKLDGSAVLLNTTYYVFRTIIYIIDDNTLKMVGSEVAHMDAAVYIPFVHLPRCNLHKFGVRHDSDDAVFWKMMTLGGHQEMYVAEHELHSHITVDQDGRMYALQGEKLALTRFNSEATNSPPLYAIISHVLIKNGKIWYPNSIAAFISPRKAVFMKNKMIFTREL